MADVVVTVPQGFRFAGKRGLAAWIAEGDAAGDPLTGNLWCFSIGGARPRIEPGERVYIVAEGKLRGYAPLVRLDCLGERRWGLIRGGNAVACTLINGGRVKGFQGWRYRWWDRSQEQPFDAWRTP